MKWKLFRYRAGELWYQSPPYCEIHCPHANLSKIPLPALEFELKELPLIKFKYNPKTNGTVCKYCRSDIYVFFNVKKEDEEDGDI